MKNLIGTLLAFFASTGIIALIMAFGFGRDILLSIREGEWGVLVVYAVFGIIFVAICKICDKQRKK